MAEAPGLASGVDDGCSVGDPVDDGLGEAGVGEDLVYSPKGRLVVTISDARSLRSR